MKNLTEKSEIQERIREIRAKIKKYESSYKAQTSTDTKHIRQILKLEHELNQLVKKAFQMK